MRVKQGQEIGNRIARAGDNGNGIIAHAAGMQWIGVKESLFAVLCFYSLFCSLTSPGSVL